MPVNQLECSTLVRQVPCLCSRRQHRSKWTTARREASATLATHRRMANALLMTADASRRLDQVLVLYFVA